MKRLIPKHLNKGPILPLALLKKQGYLYLPVEEKSDNTKVKTEKPTLVKKLTLEEKELLDHPGMIKVHGMWVKQEETPLITSDSRTLELKDSDNFNGAENARRELYEKDASRTYGAIGEFTNRLMPTTIIGGIVRGLDINDYISNGNSGIVTDLFAKDHPYMAGTVNFVGDFILPWGLGKTAKGLKYLNNNYTLLYPKGRLYSGITFPEVVKKSSNITENLTKFIGLSRGNTPINLDKLSKNSSEYLLAKQLLLSGVDLSKFTKEDLLYMLAAREEKILETAPERFHLVKSENDGLPVIYDANGDEAIGYYRLYNDGKGNLSIDNIENVNPIYRKGSERAYNTAILYAKDFHLNPGVRSGDDLISAPKTYSVWRHFPNKKLIGNYGLHSNSKMVSEAIQEGRTPISVENDYPTLINNVEDMRGDSKVLINEHGPVYQLLEKSKEISPAKSIIFDPKIIDANGNMQINWDDPSLLTLNNNELLFIV